MKNSDKDIEKRKICSKCKEDKKLTDFYKNKKSKDNLEQCCKFCKKQYLLNNNDRIKEYLKLYRSNPINKEINKNYQKDYRSKNSDKIKEQIKNWLIENKPQTLNYFKNKYNNNIEFKIKMNLGNRIRNLLKKANIDKNNKTLNLIGCGIEDFKIWLESQFLPYFTWDNHGIIWEIDHKIPCSSFNLLNEDEQKQCFHFTNLMPRFKTTEIAEQHGSDQIGNRNKSNKIL